MRHDIDRLRAEIEAFHADPPATGDRDCDDFFLVHVKVEPVHEGPLTLEINRGDGEYEMELVAAHSVMRPRCALLEWAKVLGRDDPWVPLDARLDLATVKLARELPEPLRDTGRIIPESPEECSRRGRWGGRPLVMALSIRYIEPIDMVLVFDRFPITKS